MFVSEDGTVTGSVNRSQLADVEPKTDEARAQLETLTREAEQAETQAALDAARSTAAAAGQSPGAVLDVEIERLEVALEDLKRRRAEQKSPAAAGGRPQAEASNKPAASSSSPSDDAELEQARKDAAAAGVQVDNRWGVERLRQETAAAQQATAAKRR